MASPGLGITWAAFSSPTPPAASAPAAPAGGRGPRLDRGADAADVAPDHDADQAAVELDDRAGGLDAGRLEHGVHRGDQADETLRLDQAQSIPVHEGCLYQESGRVG